MCWPTRVRRGPADAVARLPALWAPFSRGVHVRWRATPDARLAHRPRRTRLRRGLDLREPRRRDDRALVPLGRLPSLADGSPRHEYRCRDGDQLMGTLADR